EGDALLRDLPLVRQREDLEAARVGEDRPVPAREAVQAAVRLDDLQPRAQEQVEGVAEDHLRAERAQLAREHPLDGAVGADRHERRGFDRAARERHPPAARGAVGAQQPERHPAHSKPTSASSARRRRTGAPAPSPPSSAGSSRSTSTTTPPSSRMLATWPGPRKDSASSSARTAPSGSRRSAWGRSSTSPPRASPSAAAGTSVPRPMKPATKRSRGWRYSASAPSHCRMRPPSITPMWSAIAKASPWSWVT